MPPIRTPFPDDFVFGVSTSAYQIEGAQFGNAGASIWDDFARNGGTQNGDDGAIACDHYHRFEDDLDLIKAGGFDAYRFSFSWARLFPDGETLNPEGVAFYHRLLDAMDARGIKPYATVYHWDMPAALARKGAWLSRENVGRFGVYCGFIGREFGARLASIATVNEPWCVAWLSHFSGAHAPGHRDIAEAVTAMHHVMLGHGLGLAALRAETTTDIGIVLNFTPAIAATDAPADIMAANWHNALYNEWYLLAVTHGRYPDAVLEKFGHYLPENWRDDMVIISAPIDFLGINYYTSNAVKLQNELPYFSIVPRGLPETDMGWEIDPDAFGRLFDWVATFTGELPLYVTENGMASAHAVDDPDRVAYFKSHLAVTADRANRLPIKGYFAWSLLDNFEWSFGYAKRFGIVHVDYETQTRTPKASYHWWQDGLG